MFSQIVFKFVVNLKTYCKRANDGREKNDDPSD